MIRFDAEASYGAITGRCKIPGHGPPGFSEPPTPDMEVWQRPELTEMPDWVDGAIAGSPPASNEAIRSVEAGLRIRLPKDFLAIAQRTQGARPEPGSFTLPDGTVTGIQHLLHFEETPFLSNIVARREPVARILPKGVIPFAEALGGDLLCFNFRGNYDHPPVLFWSVDSGLVPLADSFTSLLALLHR